MNALIVVVDHTPASRERATSAAHLAAAMNRPLHLVFGTGPRLCGTVAVGCDSYFIDTEVIANSVLANLTQQLQSIAHITHSVLPLSPSAALRKETKRLGASPVVLDQSLVGRVATRFRSERRRPVRCPVALAASI